MRNLALPRRNLERVRFVVSLGLASLVHVGISAWVLASPASPDISPSVNEVVYLDVDVMPVDEPPSEDDAAASAAVPPAPEESPAASRTARKVVRPVAAPAVPTPAPVEQDETQETVAAAPAEAAEFKTLLASNAASSLGETSEVKGPLGGGPLAGRGSGGSSKLKGKAGTGRGTAKLRGARLLPAPNACRGVFPDEALKDEGTVTVALRVANSGRPFAPRVVDEFPSGQGFARAAQTCVERLRFEPAANAEGQPIASNSVVRLRFARGY